MYDMPQEMFSRVVGEEQMTRLDDIQARHAAITPGPWRATGDDWIEGADGQDIAQGVFDEQWDADAEFIAHCPDDVRWLLDRVTQLTEALTLLADKAEQYFDTERGDLDGAVDFARATLDTEQT
jgi:hypothetical protein